MKIFFKYVCFANLCKNKVTNRNSWNGKLSFSLVLFCISGFVFIEIAFVDNANHFSTIPAGQIAIDMRMKCLTWFTSHAHALSNDFLYRHVGK